MSVVVRHHASGMTADQYSAVATPTTDALRNASGFIAHYAFAEGDGMTVSEIWESQADHDKFFDEVIRPKLPQEIPPPAVFDVINTITP
jgi:heme-degrading monooxygenase HmoA